MRLNQSQIALLALTISLLFLAYGVPIVIWLSKVIKLPSLDFLKRRKQASILISGERLSDNERLRHTHILGSTGSGKTVLMENLIYEDLARGYGMFIIDPKGDRDLYDRVKHFCKKIGREQDLHFFTANYPNESVRWNPCRLGIPSEIQSKFINSWDFSEVYYAKSCEAVLLEALNKLGNTSFTMNELVRGLETIASQKKDDSAKALFLDFYNTIEGEWGEILCGKPACETTKEITLLDVIRKNEILFVDLPTEGKTAQSSRLGKLLLQEIMLISGMRKTYPHIRSDIPFSIYVDEFDAFATQSFATFLNKGRSSGFMIHICHQTLADLLKIDKGIGSFLGQIQGNINNRFFFRIDDPTDAETISAFFGTEKVMRRTIRVADGSETNDASQREAHEYRIHPDRIKELGIGECIFSSKTSRRLKELKLSIPKQETYFKKLPTLRESYIWHLQRDEVDSEYGSILKKTKKEKKTCVTL